MKYFRSEKLEGMTVRSYSITKIIAFSLGILLGLSTPKEERKLIGGLTFIGLVLAGLYALSQVVTCTLQIGFSNPDDEEDYDWDDEEDSSLSHDDSADFMDDWQEET